MDYLETRDNSTRPRIPCEPRETQRNDVMRTLRPENEGREPEQRNRHQWTRRRQQAKREPHYTLPNDTRSIPYPHSNPTPHPIQPILPSPITRTRDTTQYPTPHPPNLTQASTPSALPTPPNPTTQKPKTEPRSNGRSGRPDPLHPFSTK